jgi:transposase
VIRVDATWLAAEPLDMRAGADTALARVVNAFGEARAHHAYLFVNKRANRMKLHGSSQQRGLQRIAYLLQV